MIKKLFLLLVFCLLVSSLAPAYEFNPLTGKLDKTGASSSSGSGTDEWEHDGVNVYLKDIYSRVGIGTANPGHPLDVPGQINSGFDITVTGKSVCLEDGTNCPPAVFFDTLEHGDTTWGGEASFVWTMDSGATKPTLTFGNGTTVLSNSSLEVGGSVSTIELENGITLDNNEGGLFGITQVGGVNNNNIRLDMDSVADTVVVDSNNGVDTIDFSAIDLTTTGDVTAANVNATTFTGDGSALTGITAGLNWTAYDAISTLNDSDKIAVGVGVNTRVLNWEDLQGILPSGGSGPGTGTADRITYWDTTTTLGSLSTSTYPSLTELSYVKGATSNLQTQIDGITASGWTDGGASVYNTTTSDNVGVGTTSPQHPFQVRNKNFYSDTGGNVGIGFADTNAHKLSIQSGGPSWTVASGNTGNTFAAPYLASSGNVTGWAFTNYQENFSGNPVTVGVDVQHTAKTTGSSSSSYGIKGGVLQTATSSTVANIYGVYGQNTKNGSGGTVTNSYGVYAAPATVSAGTVTNNYALGAQGWSVFVGNVGIGTSLTGNYATVKPGNGSLNVYGNIGVGTWLPSQKVDVIGTVKATAFSGDGAAVTGVTEAGLNLSDVTTGNVSTTKHGFVPKAPNDATYYLDGTGAYSIPAGGGGSSAWVDGGTNVYLATTSDQVAIGTTTPIGSNALTVVGGIASSGTSAGSLVLTEATANGSNTVTVAAPSSLTGDRSCTLDDDSTPMDGCVTPSGWVDGGANMTLATSTDNVGIGTTAPDQRLKVEGSSTANVSMMVKNTNSAGIGSVKVQNSAGTGFEMVATGSGYAVANTYGVLATAGESLSFGESDGTINMRINPAGTVRFTPTDTPDTCDAGTEGSLYYDNSLNEFCDCDGSSWAQIDGGGAC